MKKERMFCPHCYAIRNFEISNAGIASCEKGCTYREDDLIKLKPKESKD